MGLNVKALKNVQNQLNEKSSGDDMFFYQKDIDTVNGTDVRILPPHPEMNGMYFQAEEIIWVNKKPNISPKTFGESCPMTGELTRAKLSKDEDVAYLAESDDVRRRTQYLIPVLMINAVYNANDELESEKVESLKILVCGPQLMKEINRIVTHRQYQNGTEDGITDQKKGFNITLNKDGTGMDTKYTAMGWLFPTSVDEKWYKDLPNLVEMTRKKMKTDKYLMGIISNYLYGSAAPEEAGSERYKSASKDEGSKPKKRRAVEEDVEEEAPRRKKRSAPEPDEEEEDEAPKKRKRPAPAPVEEEEDEEEDEEEEAPKAKTKAKSAPSKSGKRNILKDMFADEDED